MGELGSKSTLIRCETKKDGGYDLFFVLLPAGLVGLLMVMLALLCR
jgi:hypothetical protein